MPSGLVGSEYKRAALPPLAHKVFYRRTRPRGRRMVRSHGPRTTRNIKVSNTLGRFLPTSSGLRVARNLQHVPEFGLVKAGRAIRAHCEQYNSGPSTLRRSPHIGTVPGRHRPWEPFRRTPTISISAETAGWTKRMPKYTHSAEYTHSGGLVSKPWIQVGLPGFRYARFILVTQSSHRLRDLCALCDKKCGFVELDRPSVQICGLRGAKREDLRWTGGNIRR
jgi:hypothetical protein